MAVLPNRSWTLTLVSLVAVILSTVFSGTALASSSSAPPQAQTQTCDPSCTADPFWGAKYSWMQSATQYWPQIAGNYCGVANIQTMNLYDWLKYNGTTNPTYASQSAIAVLLNSTGAISPWGVALSRIGQYPGFKADIAADYGTDPRAIAWAIYQITPPGYWFHNYTYSESDNSTANSATYQVGSDFGSYNGVNDPVSVTIWGGRHSLIEDGVYANSDPSKGGETISGIDLWDPAYGYNGKPGYLFGYKNADVDTYDWENTKYTPTDGAPDYWFWKTSYDTGFGGIPTEPENTEDPDPDTSGGGTGTTQKYYNVKTYDSSTTVTLLNHWGNAWVTIEQDYVNTVCGGSPNYALDRYGSLDPYNGSVACG